MNLVELVFSREERTFSNKFKENTTKTPNIHFLIIITVSHETFRRTIPSSRNVLSVGVGTVFSFARAQICKFYMIILHKNVLRFDISMENTFLMHVVYRQ